MSDLPRLIGRVEFTVSCDRPKDLQGRMGEQTIRQRCLHCLQYFDIEAFQGRKLCQECHQRRRDGCHPTRR